MAKHDEKNAQKDLPEREATAKHEDKSGGGGTARTRHQKN